MNIENEEKRYLKACKQIIDSGTFENLNYKDQVGTILYDFISQIIGPKAFMVPKITGMLIDLPIEEIKHIL